MSRASEVLERLNVSVNEDLKVNLKSLIKEAIKVTKKSEYNKVSAVIESSDGSYYKFSMLDKNKSKVYITISEDSSRVLIKFYPMDELLPVDYSKLLIKKSKGLVEEVDKYTFMFSLKVSGSDASLEKAVSTVTKNTLEILREYKEQKENTQQAILFKRTISKLKPLLSKYNFSYYKLYVDTKISHNAKLMLEFQFEDKNNPYTLHTNSYNGDLILELETSNISSLSKSKFSRRLTKLFKSQKVNRFSSEVNTSDDSLLQDIVKILDAVHESDSSAGKEEVADTYYWMSKIDQVLLDFFKDGSDILPPDKFITILSKKSITLDGGGYFNNSKYRDMDIKPKHKSWKRNSDKTVYGYYTNGTSKVVVTNMSSANFTLKYTLE